MQVMDAVRHIISSSGKGGYGLSKELGKSRSYVSVLLRAGDVKATTLATIAHACGYDLVLVQRDGGDTVKIDGRDD